MYDDTETILMCNRHLGWDCPESYAGHFDTGLSSLPKKVIMISYYRWILNVIWGVHYFGRELQLFLFSSSFFYHC